MTTTIAIVAILVLATAPLGAQSPATVIGTVTSETGIALLGVDVAVGDTQLKTVTDEHGAFRLSGVPAGTREVRARRLGFRPDAVQVNIGDSGTERVSLKLAVATQELQPVVVRGQAIQYTGRLAGYYERMEHGISGAFITRDQIDREHPRSVKQLLRKVPGITGIRERDGSPAERVRGTTCAPLVWLDGNAMPMGQVDLDTIDPSSLEGIEIYLSATSVPARYSWSRDMYFCGAILLWTRSFESEGLIASLSVYTADQVDKAAALDSASPLVIPYPPSLYAAHTRGTVVAEFVVDGEGHVEPGTVGIISSTNPLFTDAVTRAVDGASFIPALRAGKTVRQLVQQPFEFTGAK
jgi:TonB family protein